MSHSSTLVSSITSGVAEAVAKPIIGAAGGGLGPDIVTNGTFDTDTAWSKGGGWSISGGTANALNVTSYFFQTNTVLEFGKNYEITYTITSFTSGQVRTGLGGLLRKGEGTFRNATGTYTQTIQRTQNDDLTDYYGLYGEAFTGSIDNFIVREVLG